MKPVTLAAVPATVLALTLAGCAPIPRLTEADAASWGTRFDDAYACRSAGGERAADATLSAADLETVRHNRALWLKEIVRRGLLTEQDLRLIAAHQVAAGMSQCALYASWGVPIRENRAAYMGQPRTQYVYPGHRYVYTVNGKVTSWQDFE